MTRLLLGIPLQLRLLLEENELDVDRCTEVSVEHSAEGRVTLIRVTMLAKNPDYVPHLETEVVDEPLTKQEREERRERWRAEFEQPWKRSR